MREIRLVATLVPSPKASLAKTPRRKERPGKRSRHPRFRSGELNLTRLRRILSPSRTMRRSWRHSPGGVPPAAFRSSGSCGTWIRSSPKCSGDVAGMKLDPASAPLILRAVLINQGSETTFFCRNRGNRVRASHRGAHGRNRGRRAPVAVPIGPIQFCLSAVPCLALVKGPQPGNFVGG